MRELLELIRWWEPLLITLAILAVVFEKRLIVFENRVFAKIRSKMKAWATGHPQYARIIARLFQKHARQG